MTIGKKIKFVRKLRKMSQQELGVAVGLEEKGAANRIAQYECDYRVPQKDMLIDMAKAMDINPLNFVSEVPGSADAVDLGVEPAHGRGGAISGSQGEPEFPRTSDPARRDREPDHG